MGVTLIQVDRQMDECTDMKKLNGVYSKYANMSERYTFTKLQHKSIDLVLNVLSKNINCSAISINYLECFEKVEN